MLQGLRLVHLLDQYKASPRIPPGRIREAESLIFTFLEREAHEIAEVLADSNIHTAVDVVDWGWKQKYAVLARCSQVASGTELGLQFDWNQLGFRTKDGRARGRNISWR